MALMVHEGSITALGLAGAKSMISSTVTRERRAASTTSFCTPTIPSSSTLPRRVRALRVNDGHIRPVRRHACQALAGEGAIYEADVRIHGWQIGAQVAAEEGAGHARRAGRVGVRHSGVAVLFDFERVRPIVLDRIPQAVQWADAGISAPGEHQLARASAADHLVVEQVRGHADQGQIAALLADNLVTGGERNQVGEAFERHRVAVVDEFGDGIF